MEIFINLSHTLKALEIAKLIGDKNAEAYKMTIDLTNNSKGVYLLKLTSNKDVKLIKLLKN